MESDTIAYLFTEMKCNLDCNYCRAYDNRDVIDRLADAGVATVSPAVDEFVLQQARRGFQGIRGTVD